MIGLDRAVRTWRKKRQRGVSPIIATILLVAITVVLAAVLYVLISGLTHGGGSVPYSISMGSPNWNGNSGTIAISGVSGGLKTSLFGLSVATIGGSPVPISTAAVAATCEATKAGNPTSDCTAPTAGWYAVLYYTGNGSIANVWVGSTTATSGSWTATWSVAISSGAQSLLILGSTAAKLPGSGDTMSAYGLTSSSVSGSSGSF